MYWSVCVCPKACAVTGVAVSFLCSLSHVGCSDMCSLATKACSLSPPPPLSVFGCLSDLLSLYPKAFVFNAVSCVRVKHCCAGHFT